MPRPVQKLQSFKQPATHEASTQCVHFLTLFMNAGMLLTWPSQYTFRPILVGFYFRFQISIHHVKKEHPHVQAAVGDRPDMNYHQTHVIFS